MDMMKSIQCYLFFFSLAACVFVSFLLDASGAQTGASSIGELREKGREEERAAGLHGERRGEGDERQTGENDLVDSHVGGQDEDAEGKKEIEVEEDLLRLSKDEEDLLSKARTVDQIKEVGSSPVLRRGDPSCRLTPAQFLSMIYFLLPIEW